MSCDRVVKPLTISALAVCAAAVVAMHVPPAAAIGVVTIVTTAALTRFAHQTRRHQQLDAALRRNSVPAVVDETRVRLAPIDAAFVTGVWRPTIYCSHDMPSRLTDGELRAVLLHERAHQRAHDPLRLLLLAVVAPVARLHDRGRAWLEDAAAAREIAADRDALERGASRHALASALLKVAPVTDGRRPGFASAAELRLRALVAPDPCGLASPRRWPWMLAGAVVATTVCMAAWPVVEVLCCR